SSVVIALPCASAMVIRQDCTAAPSARTVQAPHWPRPQPNFVAVRPRPRSTYSSGLSASDESTRRTLPLTRRSWLGIYCSLFLSARAGNDGAEHRQPPAIVAATSRAICKIYATDRWLK